MGDTITQRDLTNLLSVKHMPCCDGMGEMSKLSYACIAIVYGT